MLHTSQDLDRLGEQAVPDFLDEFDTYLVDLSLLEERTRLTFSSLRWTATPAEVRRQTPVRVEEAESINW